MQRLEIFELIGLDKYHNYMIFDVLKNMEHIEFGLMAGEKIVQYGTLELGENLRAAQTFGTFESCVQFLRENLSDIQKSLKIVKLVWCPIYGWKVREGQKLKYS